MAKTGSLKENKTTTWSKREYDHLDVSWAGDAGTGTVSLKQGDRAQSLSVPVADRGLDREKDGSLTNHTDKTVNYKLS